METVTSSCGLTNEAMARPNMTSTARGSAVRVRCWTPAESPSAPTPGAKPDGIPLVMGPGWQVQPRIAFANGEYLMTYRDNGPLSGPDIWAIRVSTAGQLLSSAFRISNSNDEAGGRYDLASNGRDYFVVWADNRGSPSGFGYPKIYGALV